MREVRPASALAHGLPVERVRPVLLPLGKLLSKLFLLQRGQLTHEFLEGYGGRFSRFSNRGKGNNCPRSRSVAACKMTYISPFLL